VGGLRGCWGRRQREKEGLYQQSKLAGEEVEVGGRRQREKEGLYQQSKLAGEEVEVGGRRQREKEDSTSRVNSLARKLLKLKGVDR